MHPPTLFPLRPGLRLVERDLGDFAVRAALVTHGERALLFDTLAHPRDMRAVGKLLVGRTVEVAYSHADWDHCWGTAGLPPVAAVVAQTEAASRFRTDVPLELAAKRQVDPAYDDVRLVPPDATFRHHMDVSLDGLLVELHALPGHTSDSAVAFVPSWGVLLAGDAVETPLPVVNDDAAVAGWLDRLEAWAQDPRVGRVVPSHGAVGGREILERNADYLRGLVAGREQPPARAGVLGPFYRETHARNVALLGG